MHIDPAAWFPLGTGATLFLTKLFLNFARSMPPPPSSCGFWCRWSFDFIQSMADNADRHGQVRQPLPPAEPIPPIVDVPHDVLPVVLASSVDVKAPEPAPTPAGVDRFTV